MHRLLVGKIGFSCPFPPNYQSYLGVIARALRIDSNSIRFQIGCRLACAADPILQRDWVCVLFGGLGLRRRLAADLIRFEIFSDSKIFESKRPVFAFTKRFHLSPEKATRTQCFVEPFVFKFRVKKKSYPPVWFSYLNETLSRVTR